MSEVDSMAVGTLVSDEVARVGPDATLQEAAEVLAGRDVGLVVVGSDKRVTGVISERDVVRAVAGGRDLASTQAAEMASTELSWADASSSVQSVATEMLDHWVRHVLVERDGALVGVVSARDLLGAYAMSGEADD